MKYLLLLTVLLPLATAQNVPNGSFFVTPSGYEVPVALVRKVAVDNHSTDQQKLLFEVTKSNQLLGHNFSIDLNTEPQGVRTLQRHQDFTLLFNDRHHRKRVAHTEVRTISGYDVAVSQEDGRVISVTGNGLNLIPLHRVQHPDVFIHSAHSPFTNI